MTRSIILVGPMGAGKSTIGKLLAAELKLPFLDIDQMVVENTGADIPWIFDVEGEQGFRQRETQALEQALASQAAIIATGGGIVTQEKNNSLIGASSSLVVFLSASVNQQFRRTSRDKNRPLLQNKNPKQVLKDLMRARLPLYQQVADLIVETDHYRPKEVVVMIADKWRNH